MENTMSNEKERTTSWLVPALVGAFVALIGSAITYYLTSWKDTREHTRGVAIVRAQIIESATGTTPNLTAARLTLDYVLKPIDETGNFDEFSNKVIEIFADQAPQTSPGERDSLPQVTPVISGEIADLINKFTGPERLAASNALVERSKIDQVAVVDALINKLRKQDEEFSYRFNLYVVFTLARIPGGWSGTESQRNEVMSLRETSNYSDATFRSRTEEAILNWRKR
jgi:hypothetical protein